MTTRTLNVLHVCDHLGWEGSHMRGLHRLFSWMIPRFDPARFNVSLVSLRKKEFSEKTLESSGVDISYLHKSTFDPATLTALLKVVDRKTIDILHLHGCGATTFGRAAAAMRRLPTVLHEHAHATGTPWLQSVADRALEPFTDIAIAMSQRTADFVINARHVPARKVKVVYLGAPCDEFSRARGLEEIAAARRALGLGPRDFAIGTVTRLHGSTGNPWLVDAARLVLDVRPDARFVVVGEGPLRQDLEAQAARLELGDRFVFAGFATDAAATLSALDLTAFLSLGDGTTLTVFEALAAGKPIVATDADGLPDMLRHDRDARIVSGRDPRAVADQVLALMGAPADRARLSASARVTGRRYDIRAFVHKMERLYTILHDVSRRTRRRGVLDQDLSFLTAEQGS